MRRGYLLIVLVGALGCGLKPYSSGTEGGGVSGGTSGTAMGGEGTSGGGGGTTDGGCAFIGCKNDVGAPPSCDLWAQDCPDGQKCAPFANGDVFWNDSKCVPVMPGAGMAGDPCTVEGGAQSGVDSCAKGYMCWDVSVDTGIGTCVEQCAGSERAPVCSGCTRCYIAGDGILNFCTPMCSPLEQDCPDGEQCVALQSVLDYFFCQPPAPGQAGAVFESCTDFDQCAPGLWCAPSQQAIECDPQQAGCCLPFCKVSAPSCPGAGQQCVPWFAMGQASDCYQDVGSCRLPP